MGDQGVTFNASYRFDLTGTVDAFQLVKRITRYGAEILCRSRIRDMQPDWLKRKSRGTSRIFSFYCRGKMSIVLVEGEVATISQLHHLAQDWMQSRDRSQWLITWRHSERITISVSSMDFLRSGLKSFGYGFRLDDGATNLIASFANGILGDGGANLDEIMRTVYPNPRKIPPPPTRGPHQVVNKRKCSNLHSLL